MKKVIIYTAADKRPDFIPVQYESFKKFITDDYEYVVLNNATGSKKRRDLIAETCQELGIKCIEVKKDSKFNIIGGQKSMNVFGFYKNANVGTAYPIKWAWENICETNKENLVVIIDSDMFLCREISFNQELGDNDTSLVIQYRGIKTPGQEADVTYPWNGICIFDVAKIPDLKNLNWDCGIMKDFFVNGHAVDVGGYGHFWLAKNKPKIKHISEYAIHDYKKLEDGRIWISGNINGNFQHSFEYDQKTKKTNNFKVLEKWWNPGDQILPHFPKGFETIMMQKMIECFEKFILEKQSYLSPAFLGFIEFESFAEGINPFIIHNKAGSGYMGFDAKYGNGKFAFIKKTLDIEIDNDRFPFELKDSLFGRNLKENIKMIMRKVKNLKK